MKTAKKTTAEPLVWHIVKWFQRFETKDTKGHYRQRSLLFTKVFCGTKIDDDSTQIEMALESLHNHKDWHMFNSCWNLLKCRSGRWSLYWRGFLLIAPGRAATTSDIAAWLRLSVKDTRRVLATLQRVGLLDKQPLSTAGSECDPGQVYPEYIPDPPPLNKTTNGKTEKEVEKKRPSANGKGEKEKEKETASAAPPPKTKPKTKKKTKTTKPKSKTKPKGKTKAEPRGKGKGDARGQAKAKAPQPTPTPMPTPTGQGHQDAQQAAGDVGDQPEPTEPTKADGPHAGAQDRTETKADGKGGGDVPRGCSHPPSISEERLDELYDDEQFAAMIFETLGLANSAENHKRELPNFAIAWAKAKASQLTPFSLEQLWHNVEKVAVSVAKRRQYAGKRAKVWRGMFNQELDKVIVNQRGSPAA